MTCTYLAISCTNILFWFLSLVSMTQKGISGNKAFGCDAIIVSGAREDGDGLDDFSHLVYVAESTVGGGSILTSAASTNRIRVFRSSVLQNPYQARAVNQKKNASALYRYDGLYRVTKVSFTDAESGITVYEAPEHLSPIVSRRLYRFWLRRVEAGIDAHMNEMADDKFMDYCRSQGTMFAIGSSVAGVPTRNCVRQKKRHKSNDADNRADSFDAVSPAQRRRLNQCQPPYLRDERDKVWAANQLLSIKSPRHKIATEWIASQNFAEQ
jgi:hypothetical protein